MRGRKFDNHVAFNRARNVANRPVKPEFDKLYCIYHDADLDGVLSAFLILEQFPYAILMPYDHGKIIDLSIINEGEGVIIVDCCLSKDDMEFLNKTTRLYLFDHHERTCKDVFYKKFKGRRSLNEAACNLVFDFFNPFSICPSLVKWIGHYDSWYNEDKTYWNKIVVPFQYAMRQYDLNPKDPIFKELLGDDEKAKDLVNEGNIICNYLKKQARTVMDKYSYTTQLKCKRGHYKVLVINRQMVSLEFFESKLDKSKHDFCVAYQEKNGMYRYSLRSWTGSIDVNKIAMEFSDSGGGHKYAAGFSVNRNIFD
jgi:oligoribonuclease NrnB/cAMP/cGMP phosphodiesterase (DHH superfamily)